MRIRQMTISALFAAALATLPVSTARAQYYPPPCSPFPLSWPFCVVGAVVGTAAMIVTAPIWAITGAPPYYYGYYWQPYALPPGYSAPYYPPQYYYPPR
jgi:hypothetical protein